MASGLHKSGGLDSASKGGSRGTGAADGKYGLGDDYYIGELQSGAWNNDAWLENHNYQIQHNEGYREKWEAQEAAARADHEKAHFDTLKAQGDRVFNDDTSSLHPLKYAAMKGETPYPSPEYLALNKTYDAERNHMASSEQPSSHNFASSAGESKETNELKLESSTDITIARAAIEQRDFERKSSTGVTVQSNASPESLAKADELVKGLSAPEFASVANAMGGDAEKLTKIAKHLSSKTELDKYETAKLANVEMQLTQLVANTLQSAPKVIENVLTEQGGSLGVQDVAKRIGIEIITNPIGKIKENFLGEKDPAQAEKSDATTPDRSAQSSNATQKSEMVLLAEKLSKTFGGAQGLADLQAQMNGLRDSLGSSMRHVSDDTNVAPVGPGGVGGARAI